MFWVFIVLFISTCFRKIGQARQRLFFGLFLWKKVLEIFKDIFHIEHDTGALVFFSENWLMFPLVQTQNWHQEMEGGKHLDWRANVPPAALRTLSFRTTIDKAKTWCWWWCRKSSNFTIIIIMSKLWQFKSELVTLGAGLWTASSTPAAAPAPQLHQVHLSCTFWKFEWNWNWKL